MKRFISTLLTTVMLLSSVPINAFADDYVIGNIGNEDHSFNDSETTEYHEVESHSGDGETYEISGNSDESDEYSIGLMSDGLELPNCYDELSGLYKDNMTTLTKKLRVSKDVWLYLYNDKYVVVDCNHDAVISGIDLSSALTQFCTGYTVYLHISSGLFVQTPVTVDSSGTIGLLNDLVLYDVVYIPEYLYTYDDVTTACKFKSDLAKFSTSNGTKSFTLPPYFRHTSKQGTSSGYPLFGRSYSINNENLSSTDSRCNFSSTISDNINYSSGREGTLGFVVGSRYQYYAEYGGNIPNISAYSENYGNFGNLDKIYILSISKSFKVKDDVEHPFVTVSKSTYLTNIAEANAPSDGYLTVSNRDYTGTKFYNAEDAEWFINSLNSSFKESYTRNIYTGTRSRYYSGDTRRGYSNSCNDIDTNYFASLSGRPFACWRSSSWDYYGLVSGTHYTALPTLGSKTVYPRSVVNLKLPQSLVDLHQSKVSGFNIDTNIELFENYEYKPYDLFVNSPVLGENLNVDHMFIISCNDYVSNGKDHDIIQVTKDMVTGYNPNQLGVQNLTITYRDKVIPWTVTVVPGIQPAGAKVLKSIEVQGATTEYYVGDVFDGKGLLVLNYDDGTSDTIALYQNLFTGFSTATAGTKTLTASYGGKTTTIQLKVKEDIIVSTSFSGVTTNYMTGQSHDGVGYLDVNWESGKTTKLALSTLPCTAKTETAGTSTVEVLYNNQVFTYNITVKEPIKITSIAVTGMTTNYYTGDMFDGKGTLVLKSSDGSEQYVSISTNILSGFDTTTAGTKTVTVTYNGMTTKYNITVKKDTVTSVTFNGVTTNYMVGQEHDGVGYIDVIWESGKTSKVALSSLPLSLNTSQAGTATVTISYESGQYSYNVTVKDYLKLTSIEIIEPTTSYYTGASFDGKGSILLNYNDGTKQFAALSSNLLTGFNTTTAGKRTVTVSYSGVSATYDITVKNDTVTSVTFQGISTNYMVGQAHDGVGYIDAIWESGKSTRVPLSSLSCTANTQEAGTFTVDVMYEGKTYSYNITVKDYLKLTSIEVVGNTTEYYVGDIFDGNGSMTLNYNDGTKQYVALTSNVMSGFDTRTPGTKTITVTYNNVTTTYTITVKEDNIKQVSFSGNTTQYKYGQLFDQLGYLDITYNSNKTEKIALATLSVTANTKKMGTSTVEVTYKGQKYSYNINVSEYAISKIEPQSYTTNFYKDASYDFQDHIYQRKHRRFLRGRQQENNGKKQRRINIKKDRDEKSLSFLFA